MQKQQFVLYKAGPSKNPANPRKTHAPESSLKILFKKKPPAKPLRTPPIRNTSNDGFQDL